MLSSPAGSRYTSRPMVVSHIEAVIAQILTEDPPQLVANWMDLLRADPTCWPPEVMDELEALGTPLIETLAEACREGSVDLSADHFRAAVRDFSFVGGQLASKGASPSVLARLTPSLTDCLAPALDSPALQATWRMLEVGLSAIMTETYCIGLQAKDRAVLEEVLEKHTPIIRLPGDVPALLVVGSPSRQSLSILMGRLLLEVARMGADVLFVDFTNAQPLDRAVLGVIEELLEHRKLQQRQVVVTSLRETELRELRTRLGPRDNVRFCDSWGEGLSLLLD
jgi:hypothetical protein